MYFLPLKPKSIPSLKILIVFLFLILPISFLPAQELTTFLGLRGFEYFEDDRPLITAEVHSLLSENPVAFKHWKTSRTHLLAAGGAALVSLGTGISWKYRPQHKKASAALIVTCLGSAVISGALTQRAIFHKKKAVLKYNKGLKQQSSFLLNPLLDADGIGLSLQF